MRFECSKRWEEMAVTDRGRFCDSCEKPVIDFTGWSREELIAWFKREPETCGVFERHQIDPRYVPIEHLGRTARRGFFAAVAAFSLQAVQAQAPGEPSATEQVARTPGSVVQGSERPLSYSVNPKKTWEECPAIPDRSPRRKKVRVYVSGSFPFLHIGRRRFRTTGCPAF
jgi:hypothetical protein